MEVPLPGILEVILEGVSILTAAGHLCKYCMDKFSVASFWTVKAMFGFYGEVNIRKDPYLIPNVTIRRLLTYNLTTECQIIKF